MILLVFAKKDITKGTVLTADALNVRLVEKTSTPKDAFSSIDALVNKVTKYDVRANHYISTGDLVPSGTRNKGSKHK